MSETRHKVFGIVEVALLAGLVLQADRYVPESHAEEKPVALALPSKPQVFFNSDVLHECRQSNDAVDGSCAANQTIEAISANDSVEAGMWSYHVTDPSEQLVIDQLELQEAQQASRAKKTGECLLWSNRVMAPELVMQLPECD